MSDEKAQNQRVVIPVTKEEYEQFLADKTYLPECLHLDGHIVPDCEGSCPQGLVCTIFIYSDKEKGIDAEWYACAPPEVFEQIADRVVLVDDTQNNRKLKFFGYTLK